MLSIALAKIFAIYLIVMGISLLINRRFFKEVLKDLIYSHIAMLIIAFMTLILGSILVVMHNVWVLDWRVSVTIFGWLVMVSGVVRTLYPTFIQKMAASMLEKDNYFYISGVLCILFGTMYGYFGFM